MNAKNKLLDKAKKMCTPQTDMALAARIGVTRSAVSVWRKGGTITAQHLETLAAVAGLDGQSVIEVMLEQANNAEARAVWRPVLDRLSAAVAAVAPATVILYATMAYGGAGAHSLYIMFRPRLARALHASTNTRQQRMLA